MTAEVAVLNSNGVALAADSAVTIGQEEGKVYTLADKPRCSWVVGEGF
jgi:hypothetical protein